MAFDFPANPAIDEVYTSGGVTYVWDGETWRSMAPPLTYVMRAGDSMTGPLRLPLAQPTIPEDATHKQYVDQTIAAASLYQGPWQVAANIPNLDPAVILPQHNYSWVAQTADKDIPEIAPPALPGVGGKNVGAGDTVIWNANTSVYDLIQQPASTAGYLPLVGGSMTGPIKMVGDGAVGQLWLSQGGATQNGIIEFRDSAGVRAGYFGWGDATNIDLSLEGAGAFRINGGNIYMQSAGGIHYGNNSAVTSVTDFSKGICLYGYGGTSQFGLNITSGTLNLTVQQTGNQIAFNVGTEQVMNVKTDGVRIPGGNLSVTGNISATGMISSSVAANATGLQFGDGVKIDLSNGCQMRKVYGSNQFQFHTNANQVFAFHISNTGDVFVIDTVGSTGNSYCATAPEALATAKALAVEPDKERGVDVMRVMAALLAKVKQLEADIATLKAPPRTPEPPPLPRQGRRR